MIMNRVVAVCMAFQMIIKYRCNAIDDVRKNDTRLEYVVMELWNAQK